MENPIVKINRAVMEFEKGNSFVPSFRELSPDEINIALDILVKKMGSLKGVFKSVNVAPRIVVKGNWAGPIYRTLQERLIKEGLL